MFVIFLSDTNFLILVAATLTLWDIAAGKYILINGLALILILILLTVDKNVLITGDDVIEIVRFLNNIPSLVIVSLIVILSDIDLSAVNNPLTVADVVTDSDILLNGS